MYLDKAFEQAPNNNEIKKLAIIYVLREFNLINAAKKYQAITHHKVVYFDLLKKYKAYITEYDCLIEKINNKNQSKANNTKILKVIITNILLKIINFDDDKDKRHDVYQELMIYFGEKNMWNQSTIIYDIFDILLGLDKRHLFFEYIDRIAQIEKENDEALLREVEALFGFVDNTNIIQLYDKKLEFNPNCADILNRKGDMLYSLGQFEKAIECYDKAIQIEPNSVWGHYNKACALESLGQTDDSVSFFAKASLKYIDLFKKSGKFPYAYIFLASYARLLIYHKSYETALDYLDKALEIEPKKPCLWDKKGECFSEMGKYEEAIKCYNQVLENEITYHRAWYYKAHAYHSQKDYLNALENYRQCIFYCEDNFGYIEDMGIVLRELGRYNEALICFDQVKELMPLFKRQVYYLKATVYFESGEYDKALSYVQDSLGINADHEEVQQLKGKILEKMAQQYKMLKKV